MTEPDPVDQLERFHLAMHSGRLPPDLARWVLNLIYEALPAESRRIRRNQFLKAAAAATGEASLYGKAREVSEVIEGYRLYPGEARCGVPPEGSPAEFVQRAWRVDRNLPKFRQLLEILR